jgi:hypothetical protein
MEVEDIARVCFTSWWSFEQERHLSICNGVLGEVVVDDECVFAVIEEVFSEGATDVWCDILENCRGTDRCVDHDRIVHCALVSEILDETCDLGFFLANRNIDTCDVLSFLCENCIDRNGCFSCLSITDDELSLPSSDRDHRIDCFDTGLERYCDRLSRNHTRSYSLDWIVFRWSDITTLVNRLAKTIEHSPNILFTHTRSEKFTCRVDSISMLESRIVSQDQHTDIVAIDIQDESIDIIVE